MVGAYPRTAGTHQGFGRLIECAAGEMGTYTVLMCTTEE